MHNATKMTFLLLFSFVLSSLTSLARAEESAMQNAAAENTDDDPSPDNSADEESSDGATPAPMLQGETPEHAEGEREAEGEKSEIKAEEKTASHLEGPSRGGFSAGLGVSSLSIPALETHALASVELGYRSLMASMGDSSSIWGSFHYAAHEFDAIQENVSYRGVVEIYAIGAQYHRSLDQKLTFIGSADIGVATVGLRDVTPFQREDGLTKPGAIAALQGGVEWANSPRTSLGAKLSAALGRVQAFGAVLSSAFSY